MGVIVMVNWQLRNWQVGTGEGWNVVTMEMQQKGLALRARFITYVRAPDSWTKMPA